MSEHTYTHHWRRASGVFVFDPGYTYFQEPGWKPSGLWLSVDDDWRWCEEEQLEWATAACTFRVDESELLITSVQELDAFAAIYFGRDPHGFGDRQIDWPRVAASYAGIVIAPYQWERRVGPQAFWYYGWDCASACVWDLSVLSLVREESSV